jgi:NAD(P)H-dependent flavin oxidoreductase YrpB (nitropropane dioxygenase family)
MSMLRQLDYTRGQLPELIDVIIEEKTRLFVSAVGVPPPEVIEKLHRAGILIMNVSFSLLLDSLLRPGRPTNKPTRRYR